MSYYVLRNNKTKALSHFKDAKLMMEAFEHWFGPYPFYEDGFKLVEVPYLGMEHQSAVTYGNEYKMGYLGRDLSGTGEGLKFDFIIVHESGHEWFANSLTNADVADMWIHEGFTAYSESLFLDYHYGKESAATYVVGTRRLISNDRPIQSPHRGVAHEGSGDMYYKGSNLLHTLRMVINDDAKWREILRGLNRDFRHQTISSQELIDYVAERTRTENFAPLPFFATYVQSVDIPVFSYSLKKGKLNYQWKNVPKDFKMPVDIRFGEKQIRLDATTELQSEKLGKKVTSIEVREDFYVNVQALN
jgi:aminopeptidase N